MKFVKILFLLLFLPILSFGQTKVSDLPVNLHLNQLKNGVLFVQLPRIEKRKIEILEKSDSERNKKFAKEIKEENLMLKKKIQESFSNNYSFSEIYFVEAENTKLILNGNYGNNLKDKNGNSIQLNNDATKEKYIATYGIATIAGENTRYNGDGILVQHINNGKMERIKSGLFFETTSRFLSVLRGPKPISEVVSNLNENFRDKYSPTN